MQSPIPIKLMIFDLDGTLVDSRKDIVLSVNATLEHLGLKKKNEDLISSYIGWGSVKLLADALETKDEKLISRAVDFYWQYYREHSLDHTELFPEALQILEHFDNKIKVIVSNKTREFVVHQIRALGIEGFFEKVVGGDDIKCAKPSPCPVKDILREYGVREDKAIMIGDMALDIKTGKAAGIHTCAVTFGIGDKKELLQAKPDFVISRLSQLKEIIE